jgi:hypothetical protein
VVGTERLRHQLRFGALPLTRAQEARRLLAERRAIVEGLEHAKRDYLEGAKGPSVQGESRSVDLGPIAHQPAGAQNYR